MLKQLKKVSSDNREINQLQENVEQVTSPIISKQIVDGILIRDISLTTGSIDIISHKLARKPVGYIIVKRSANSTIWDTAMNTSSMELNCSANVTVSIWVF